jgi:hypothetical protein
MFEKNVKIELDNDSTKPFISKIAPKKSAKCYLGNGVKFNSEQLAYEYDFHDARSFGINQYN